MTIPELSHAFTSLQDELSCMRREHAELFQDLRELRKQLDVEPLPKEGTVAYIHEDRPLNRR